MARDPKMSTRRAIVLLAALVAIELYTVIVLAMKIHETAGFGTADVILSLAAAYMVLVTALTIRVFRAVFLRPSTACGGECEGCKCRS